MLRLFYHKIARYIFRNPMVKRAFLLFLTLITYLCDVRSQLSEPGWPESFLVKTKAAAIIPIKVLNAIDTSYLLAEEAQKGIPNRYGIVQQMDIDIKKDGAIPFYFDFDFSFFQN